MKNFIDARKCTDDLRILLIKSECFEAFYFSLPPVTDRYIQNFISKINVIDIQILIELSIYTIHFWTDKARKFGQELLHYCYQLNSKMVLTKLCDLAKSDDWEIREEAAKVISCLILRDFSTISSWMETMVKDTNEKIRRAILVAIKYGTEYSHAESIRAFLLDLMDNYLFDSSSYVKKSFASFTIGDGFLNVCPSLVECKLDKWLSMNDVQVNCSIIRIFKSSGGVKTWPLAQKYLSRFSNCSEREIIKALNATEKYLRDHKVKGI